MRSFLLVGCMGLVVAVGCASASSGPSNGGSADAGADDSAAGDDASDDAGDDAAVDKLTWTFIYSTYFAKGTKVGHCGDSGCHATARGGFLCGTKGNCYTSITNS